MKILFAFFSFLFYCNILFGQGRAETEQIIRDNENIVLKGILLSDTILLKTVWDPGFIVNTPHNNIASGREAVFLNQRKGLIDYSSFERIIEAMEVRENLVITMGYEIFVSRNDIPGIKAGVEVKRRFTNIWMLRNNKWMQVGRHASIICK